MGFDVTFLPTHLRAPRLEVNAETAEAEVLAPLEMSDAQLAALESVVAEHGASLDENGGAVIDVPGARVALDGVGPNGGTATVWGNLEVSCQVLYAIATAGELALKTVGDEAVTTTREARERASRLDVIGPCTFVPDATALSQRIAEQLERNR